MKRGSSPRLLVFTSEQEALQRLTRMGVDKPGIAAMMPKTFHHNILLQKQECRVANILKQEMLSLGGDAAVSRGVVDCSVPHSDVILMGTQKQLLFLGKKLVAQPFGLASLPAEIERIITNAQRPPAVWRIGGQELALNSRTLIMGILNVTPDSFSDGGAFPLPEAAVAKALQMVADGADIIDIGGESSRPGSSPVGVEEEWLRLAPVLEKVATQTQVPLSVDTTKAEIARRGIACGAKIINDISALRADQGMADVIAASHVGLILMHMRGEPRTMQEGSIHYEDVLGEIGGFLEERIGAALAAGVLRENIAIDPGIGFGKRLEDNLAILGKLRELSYLGLPVMVGASRKAFIGALTDEATPAQRMAGSLAAHCLAVQNGARIVRAHDVAATRQALAVIDAALPPRD